MREEIIRMAQEAGFDYDEADKEIIVGYYGDNVTPQLERFAKLVAAAERERCAKEAEGITKFIRYQSKEHYKFASVIAAAIRALP